MPHYCLYPSGYNCVYSLDEEIHVAHVAGPEGRRYVPPVRGFQLEGRDVSKRVLSRVDNLLGLGVRRELAAQAA